MITLALVAAVGSVAVGFGLVPPLGYLSLRARGLPGFRLDLPRGDEDIVNSWHPDAGEYRVKNLDGIGAGVEVQWGRGLANDEAWLVLIVKANALGVGIPRAEIRTVDDVVVPGSPHARSVIAHRGPKQIWNTQVPCGSRSFVIATVGENWGTERLHRRIVATAYCLDNAPAALATETEEDIPVVLDLGPGWLRQRGSPPGQIQLTNGSAAILVQRSFGVTTVAAIDAFTGSHAQAGYWPVEVPFKGRRVSGQLYVRPCYDLHQTMLLWCLPNIDEAHQGPSPLLTAHCRYANEPVQTWHWAPNASTKP